MHKKRINWDFLKKTNDIHSFFNINVNRNERIKKFKLEQFKIHTKKELWFETWSFKYGWAT